MSINVARLFASIDPIAVINTISSIVVLVETLFVGKPGSGARKKRRAMRLLIRTISGGKPSRDLEVALSALVDILAISLNTKQIIEVTAELERVFKVIKRTVGAVQGYVDDPDTVKTTVVEFVAGSVDIPFLNEAQEKLILGFLVDAAVGVLMEKWEPVDIVGVPFMPGETLNGVTLMPLDEGDIPF